MRFSQESKLGKQYTVQDFDQQFIMSPLDNQTTKFL